MVAAWLQVDLALAEVERVQQEGPSAEDCATLLELERRAYELSLQVGPHQALSNSWGMAAPQLARTGVLDPRVSLSDKLFA